MHVIALAIGVSAVLAPAAPAALDETSRLTEAAQIVEQIKPEIPVEYWDRARCIIVIPDLKKAAFIFGGEYGKGVMSCRSGNSWSAPLFMQLVKGSWGFQAGAEEVDLALLVMNESGVDKLLKNKVNLGADASVAAGPVGRRGAVGTDAALTAEILSYSRSKGLFAGIDLSGGVLRPDEDANREAYGRNATPGTILASREISAPTTAAPFLRALSSGGPAVPVPRSTARSTEPDVRTTTRSTTDDDVRAQLVDAQQMIDRILSDTTPGAVGTSGTTETAGDRSRSGAVLVDRARLIQLRQQIEAAIAALNKR